MKQLTKGVSYKTLLTFLMISFLQAMAWAQDSSGGGSTSSSSNSSTTTSTTTTTQDWYTQPWVWVVGAAVLILIIVALVRSNSSGSAGTTDKVTYTKKVERDDTV